MTEKHDTFPELPLGTILQITDPRSGEAHFTMRLASGEWWDVIAAKTASGQATYNLGEKSTDAKLMRREKGTVVKGLRIGDIIAFGIQVMALPLDAVAVHLNGGKYVKIPDGMINDQGTPIRYSQVMPGTHVWAA